MAVQTTPPAFPVGEFQQAEANAETRNTYLSTLKDAPVRLRAAVAGLGPDQLDTKYKNWTMRQIVHHLADSHVHSYIRFKWALTEDNPVIKAYDENDWSDLPESRTGDLEASLKLFEGLHQRWVQLIQSMTDADFSRTFVHPEFNETVSLSAALGYYAWHCQHHTGQIQWLREQHAWT